ncbi:hypothetical protein OROMI_026035 [Orobanche minor]
MSFEFLKMLVKDRKDIPIRPVLLKVGVAFVISVGGVVYTLFRAKIIQPPRSKPSQLSPGNGNQVDSRWENGELGDDDRVVEDSSLRKIPSNKSISDRSSSGGHSAEGDSFLLPEFNELVKECNMSANISPKKNTERLLVPEIESPKGYKCPEHDEHEREIKRLQTRVKILEEREKKLEIQLLEYYGVKEHENGLMELKKQLRVNNMETKLYNLKIESLLSDNKRLEAQLVDYTNIVMELEAARTKIKALKKKLKSEAEQNREQISALQDRVMKLENEEKKAIEINQELEVVSRERKELKDELEEMKMSNQSLKLEKSDLAQKLDYVQMLASTALDNEEVLELREERRRLKKQNENLKKEIERLQADHCTDVEELVYLRWINACLRQELKNYQPGPKGTAANKMLSPKSEEKAKHLVLEHATKDSSIENISDFESGHWSSSQASCLTDIGEHDELTIDANSSPKKTDSSSKPKVFAKLKRIFKGKGSAHGGNCRKLPLERAVSVDDIAGKLSSDFQFETSRNSSGGSSSRRSFDIQRSYSRGRKSITWESSNSSSRTMDSLIEDDQDWAPDIQPQHEDARNEAKNELLKYAEALKKSHSKKFPKRAEIFGSR